MITVLAENLTKIYSASNKKKSVLALDKFNLSVDSGSIFGLLGPNGAGKTTLIKILLGITFQTSGSAKILNEDLGNYKIKSRIGYLPENHRFPLYLTGENVLRFFGRLSGKDDKYLSANIDRLLDQVKLSKWKKTKIKNYSKGMMQRLGLAQSILGNPDLIFLDEPTDGVDPIGRKEIRDILLDLKQQGKTIFINSHLLSEVELITDRVAILNKGVLIREGNVKELTEKKEEYEFIVDKSPSEKFISAFSENIISGRDKENIIIKVNNAYELNRIIDAFREEGFIIKAIIPRKETLEDIFISLIKSADEK